MPDHQFRWRRPPQAREYSYPMITTLMALGLSFVFGWMLVDPAQRGGDPIDFFAMGIVVPLSWLVPYFLWSILVTKRLQFSERIPVLTVDQQGIATMDWRGRSLVFTWATITFERVQRNASDDLLFRAGNISGSISLHDLDETPDRIVDIVNRCSKRKA